jgi:hypothetical protein
MAWHLESNAQDLNEVARQGQGKTVRRKTKPVREFDTLL